MRLQRIAMMVLLLGVVAGTVQSQSRAVRRQAGSAGSGRRLPVFATGRPLRSAAAVRLRPRAGETRARRRLLLRRAVAVRRVAAASLLRMGLVPAARPRRLAPVLDRPLGRQRVRLDVGVPGALGLGDLPLRPLERLGIAGSVGCGCPAPTGPRPGSPGSRATATSAGHRCRRRSASISESASGSVASISAWGSSRGTTPSFRNVASSIPARQLHRAGGADVTIINYTTNITNYTVVNNPVINHGVPIDRVEQMTGMRAPASPRRHRVQLPARPACSVRVSGSTGRRRAGSNRSRSRVATTPGWSRPRRRPTGPKRSSRRRPPHRLRGRRSARRRSGRRPGRAAEQQAHRAGGQRASVPAREEGARGERGEGTARAGEDPASGDVRSQGESRHQRQGQRAAGQREGQGSGQRSGQRSGQGTRPTTGKAQADAQANAQAQAQANERANAQVRAAANAEDVAKRHRPSSRLRRRSARQRAAVAGPAADPA